MAYGGLNSLKKGTYIEADDITKVIWRISICGEACYVLV